MRIVVRGGRIYDPANGTDGDVRDLWIEDGRIIDAPEDGVAGRTIDATGGVVMAGAVDLHTHIAGLAVDRARRLLAGGQAPSPPLARGKPRASGATLEGAAETLVVPGADETAREYLRLGYTTAIDAAIPAVASRLGHLELREARGIDRGFLLLLGNHELILDLLDRGEVERAREVVAFLLERSGALGIKSVNAGGVAHWKRFATPCGDVGEPVAGRAIAPRDILAFLADCADAFQLPHPLHIHAAKLGRAGNIETTLETARVLEGRRRHFAHVGFHCFGEDEGGARTSAVERWIEHLASDPLVTCDVGQVLFGRTVTITADQEVAFGLWKLSRSPFVTLDIELEAAYGSCPIDYVPNARATALQWAIGLELFLLSPDPWRVVFSTDHPNGASFVSYPTLVALLMDRELRRSVLETLHPRVVERSVVRDLDREYSFYEIATITRAAPARILGLRDKGHLGPGADADVVIYDDVPDREAMFRRPRVVIRAGEVVVEKGELRERPAGHTWRVAPGSERDGERTFAEWFGQRGSFALAQLGPRDSDLDGSRVAGARR